VKQISTFQITGMTLSGFKSYNGPMELSFGNPTIVTGGNGKGKSSVADAIAFIITGLPFFGERGIDRLHCDDNGDLFLRMGFVDGEGQAHELTRTRRSSRMTVTFDG
jgi:DNA repair exonuclease SbcCD ATPase subunit